MTSETVLEIAPGDRRLIAPGFKVETGREAAGPASSDSTKAGQLDTATFRSHHAMVSHTISRESTS